MADQVKKPSGSASGSSSLNAEVRRDKYASLSPKSVPFEDTLTERQSNQAWAKIYGGGLSAAPSEDQRTMVRYAVYVYAAKNGTSRVGNYSKPIELADGTELDSALIPRASGERRIRQFLRANMEESYDYLKVSGVMEKDERFIAKAAELGYPAEVAFAMSDWLTNCPKFTPLEKQCHDAARVHSLDRAMRSRGGKNLESLEQEGLDRELKVQGPAHGVHTDDVSF